MKRLTVWRKLGTHLRIQLIKSITSIDYTLAASILGIQVAIIIFSGLSYQIFLDQLLQGCLDGLPLWNRWDGTRYLSVAAYGYQPLGDSCLNLAFYLIFLLRELELEPG